jgi:hypothetical protein
MDEGVFLIGFSEEEIDRIRSALGDVSVLGIPQECLTWKLRDVVENRPDGRSDWHERKFLIMHGDNEFIKRVISEVKALSLGRIIFVSTTPVSLERTLDDLIKEWIEEDEYFRAYMKAKKEAAQRSRFYLDIGKG